MFKVRSVSGRVCFETSGKCVSIPGTRIQLVDKKGNLVRDTATDLTGNFRIDTGSSGEFTLKISADGFHDIECSIKTKKGSVGEEHWKVVLGSDAILPCGGGRIIGDSKPDPFA